MRDTLRFLHGDELVEIACCDPTQTVLDWLRLECRRTGTKEGCAEGDCGACTVAVGRLAGGRLRYEAINACIRFLPSLDGCQLLTVEHLKGKDGALHPVQQALVDHHGSQCGFCTPGFVMSLFTLRLNETAPDAGRIEDALAGNLCRCTGYEPIVKAALSLQGGGPDRFVEAMPQIAARLAALAQDEPLALAAGSRRFLAPKTPEALAALLADEPDALMVAGSTDVGLWVTKALQQPRTVIHLGRIEALKAIAAGPDGLILGAMASHAQAREALAALSPQLDELMRRFGSEQIRNAGTVGGNIANGSPIGDLPPALIALGARLVLARAGAGGALERRELPLESFFLAYRKQDRRAGEFVESVCVPALPVDALFHVSKISKRFDEDISTVCGAFLLRRGPDDRSFQLP